METGEVNKRLKIATEQARAHAAERRQRDAEATKAYETFLEQNVATPLMKQLASALKADGHGFTLFTPAGGLRLASDRQRDDFIELALERGDRVCRWWATSATCAGPGPSHRRGPSSPGCCPVR